MRIKLFFLSIILILSCNSIQEENGMKSQSSDHSDQKPTEALFELLSPEQSGIDFRNDLIDNPLDDDHNVMSWAHYFNGGGVAVGDLNNDGMEDLIFTGNEVKNRIYLNKGNLQFEDVTKGSNINKRKKWTTGVSLVDINGDGYLDVYMCQGSPFGKPSTERENLLYINNGDLTFTESAKEYGLNDGNHSVQAVFFDMEKDGDLDCFVYNSSRYVQIELGKVFQHLKASKKNLEAASSNLYRNDNGKFTRITEEAGMLKYGFALGNFLSDINDDGYLDIYQANDYSVPDFMYINQKDGTFKDEIKERTKQISWFAMGADCADINNDGHLDIGVVDMAATDHIRGKTLMAPMDPELFYLAVDQLKYQRQHMFNTLQLNNGDNTYANIAGLAGIQKSEWSWAALFADFDNDTHKDYFVATGFRRYVRDNDSRLRMQQARREDKSIPVSKRKELYAQIPEVPLNNFIYKNDGNLHFKEYSEKWGLSKETYSNGAAYADLDKDGDLDLIINNIDDYAYVYENKLDGKKNYLRFKLKSDQFIEGTKVYVHTKDVKQVQEYAPVRGYVSVVESYLHFGLGDFDKAEKVSVKWPNGKIEEIYNVSANQVVELHANNAKEGSLESEHFVTYFEERKSPFAHHENEFNDFETEVLVPYRQSTLGPGISIGDVNGDNLEDFYISGAANQTGSIFYQQPDGSFKYDFSAFTANKSKEELGSCLFDADGDGDLDLYVINGGNEFRDQPEMYQDKLYINDGRGNFKDESHRLPPIEESGLKVKHADFDGDGDQDLFVGGRLKPGLYPNPARSYLLENDGGQFKDVTEQWSGELMRLGMINDFLWTDFNSDGKKDLILAGEWTSILMYENTGSNFVQVNDQYFDKEFQGWWFGLHEADIDNDGDMDLIAGNLGLNSKFKATDDHPLEVLASDFDANGTCDIVLTKDYKGKKVPVRGRQCSSEQMPFIEEKFGTYKEFAEASIEDILGSQEVEKALKLQTNTFRSAIFFNENGKYVEHPLPSLAQAFPIYGIETIDLNEDGFLDIVLSGNLFNMEIETPRLDAGNGLTLINQNGESFEPIGIQTGLRAAFDAKDMKLVKGNATQLLVINNNGPLQIYEVNTSPKNPPKLTAVK